MRGLGEVGGGPLIRFPPPPPPPLSISWLDTRPRRGLRGGGGGSDRHSGALRWGFGSRDPWSRRFRQLFMNWVRARGPNGARVGKESPRVASVSADSRARVGAFVPSPSPSPRSLEALLLLLLTLLRSRAGRWCPSSFASRPFRSCDRSDLSPAFLGFSEARAPPPLVPRTCRCRVVDVPSSRPLPFRSAPPLRTLRRPASPSSKATRPPLSQPRFLQGAPRLSARCCFGCASLPRRSLFVFRSRLSSSWLVGGPRMFHARLLVRVGACLLAHASCLSRGCTGRAERPPPISDRVICRVQGFGVASRDVPIIISYFREKVLSKV